MRERDAGTWIAVGELANQPFESNHEPDEAEFRWIQAVRQIADARRNAIGVSHGFTGDCLGLALNHSRQQIEVELQQDQLLTDVVVKLGGNAVALGLLRAEQSAAYLADALEARA